MHAPSHPSRDSLPLFITALCFNESNKNLYHHVVLLRSIILTLSHYILTSKCFHYFLVPFDCHLSLALECHLYTLLTVTCLAINILRIHLLCRKTKHMAHFLKFSFQLFLAFVIYDKNRNFKYENPALSSININV